jgi:DNA-binding response OmpR family regulator
MASRKVLLVEDDQSLAESLRYNLIREGYSVTWSADGEDAVAQAKVKDPDLVILDLMLPKLDGFEVCRRIRRERNVPILVLSARDDELDKVVGLELGADDYVTKPFGLKELMARVRAMLRRSEIAASEQQAGDADRKTLTAGNLTVDVERHQVTRGDQQINLTPKEFELLVYLMRNRGIVVTRDVLLDKIWGYEFAGDTRTIDVHVRWLRSKIEETPNQPTRIVTVRGLGYKFEG